MGLRVIVGVLVWFVAVGGFVGGALAEDGGVPAGRDAALWALMDEHVDAMMRAQPVWASQLGDFRFNDTLGDYSEGAAQARQEGYRDRLDRLRALRAERRLDSGGETAWTDEDELDAELLERWLVEAIEGDRFHWRQMPVSNRYGPQVWLVEMHGRLPFLRRAHYWDYIERLKQVPGVIESDIEQMRRGMEVGRVPARVSVVGAELQALRVARDEVKTDPVLSEFFEPFAAVEDEALREAAKEVIVERVLPAYEQLGVFLRDEYIPACRETVGLVDSVDGIEAYESQIKSHTTMELSAQQVHEIGLREVARIKGEMFEVIERTDYENTDGLEGDVLYEAFVEHMRNDERFRAETAEELLDGYRVICKRVDAQLPRLFTKLPRLPYGVKALPEASAENAPSAYYFGGSIETGVAGYFMTNTSHLDERPTYEMTALALHEAVPGHHLQIALANELEGVHQFRRLQSNTAYVEGWALYAERLGLEMETDRHARGMYADPYQDFGRLTFEMWRACRLVVDTGIHGLGWSRQEAVDYLMRNTALSPHNIEKEATRYIGWAGQALGYKLGELKILELRARAEDRLGDGFDLRRFHDELLAHGPLPMDLLDEQMARWEAREEARLARGDEPAEEAAGSAGGGGGCGACQ